MPFSASAVLFHLSHISKSFLFETFFSQETKKESLGPDRLNREGGVWGHAIFGQKLLNTHRGVGRCAHKSPIMTWANALKESSKKIH